MDILVLGATGVAGRSTVPRLLDAGHRVKAHARSEQKAAALRRTGAQSVTGDADDLDTLLGWLRGVDAVVDFRVKIPSASMAALPWAWRDYVRLRDRATGRLVDCAIRADVPVVVHDTVTLVYADGGDAVLDEESRVDAPGPLAANLAAETHLRRVTAAGGRGIALRLGQLYGPDDPFSKEVLRAARRGLAMVLGDPAGFSSALHTDDIGPAVVAALEVPGGVYNVVDDEPLRRVDLVAVLAEAVGRETLRTPPSFVTRVPSAPMQALARSQRVSAEWFHQASGWRPGVASRRTGWPEAAKAR